MLHLRSARLAAGEVCGVVEVIATGERQTVSTLTELSEVLIQAGGQPAASSPPVPSQPAPPEPAPSATD